MSVTYIVRPHGAGFFSEFLKVVSVLDSLKGRDAVLVDWSVPRQMWGFRYGTAEDGNLWPHFFEPIRFDNFPENTQEVVGYPENGVPYACAAYDMYRADKTWRTRYGVIVQRYIRPLAGIVKRVDAILPPIRSSFAVGVHYRHGSHDYEAPWPIPPAGEFIRQIRRLVREKDDWVVVLATDDAKAAEEFKGAFGFRLIEQASVLRSMTEASVHENVETGAVEMGRQVLVDALLLARCDVLLHITSNIATAAGMFNPQLKMVYCRSPAQWFRFRRDTKERWAVTWWGTPLRSALNSVRRRSA